MAAIIRRTEARRHKLAVYQEAEGLLVMCAKSEGALWAADSLRWDML
jgi:hypothetical protein